jgi:hypothetical protein
MSPSPKSTFYESHGDDEREMVEVRFVKAGRVAHPTLPARAQIDAEVGMVAEVEAEWARTLVDAGRAVVLEGAL